MSNLTCSNKYLHKTSSNLKCCNNICIKANGCKKGLYVYVVSAGDPVLDGSDMQGAHILRIELQFQTTETNDFCMEQTFLIAFLLTP